MAEVLLSSEAFVKSVSSISENVSGKYILPSLRAAQEQGLKGILGETLLAKLKTLVSTGAISQTANADYKALLDNCQYYLAFTTIVDVAQLTAYKVGNFGVVKTSDTEMQNASQDEVGKVQFFYQSKADAACYELQGWLLDNRAKFPELSQNQCHKIKCNLQSAATCGIWLGGARGKARRTGR